jgi:hypothetical protein
MPFACTLAKTAIRIFCTDGYNCTVYYNGKRYKCDGINYQSYSFSSASIYNIIRQIIKYSS